MNTAEFIGKPLDGLELSDRWALTGYWIATELYAPERLPLRIIQAVGANPRECIKQLQQRGLDPALHEYQALEQPYGP